MSDPIEAGDAVFNLLSSMASMRASQNGDELLVSLAQGMAAAASIATNPQYASTVMAANAIAAAATMGKITADYNRDGKTDPADFVALVSSVATMVATGIVWANPLSIEARLATYLARGLGVVGFALFLSKDKAYAAQITPLEEGVISFV